ncbi:MAG: class I SAM-dependent methyltransferase [Selenomonadaceae bacterium]|nr:class I SAM-dependent methyltransferase [Selenomonadaceae bacterium]
MIAFIVRGMNAVCEKIAYHLLILSDRIRGVDFHEMDESGTGDGYRYECTHPRILKQLDRICHDVMPSDAVLDVGCGKGRMLAFFSRYPFRVVDGIEYNERLAEIGARNANRLQLESKIFCADVREFCFWDRYNYFYFYNPFPKRVMEICLQSILESVKRHPRKVTILYANPTCHETLLEYGFKEEFFQQTAIEQIWQPYLSVLKKYTR